MGLGESIADVLITVIKELPRPLTFQEQQDAKLKAQPNNNNTDEVAKVAAIGINLVEEWLNSIRLPDYLEVFR